MAISADRKWPFTTHGLFATYGGQVLVPTVAAGDIAIFDNLGSHRGRRALRAIRGLGVHLIFRPPYSPDLNLIEQRLAKLIRLMRAAQPRTVEELRQKIGKRIDIVSPNERSNYRSNSGKASTSWQYSLVRLLF